MAIVLLEGFDHYSSGQLILKGWTANASSALTGRYGTGQGMRAFNLSAFKTFPSGGTYTTLYTGLACRQTTITTTDRIFYWRSGTTNTLRLGNDGALAFQLYNSAGTALITSTRTVSATFWRFVEVYLVIAGASGFVELHIDGTFEASATVNIGSSGITNVGFGATAGQSTDIDDIYVLDTTTPGPNGFLGDCRVETLYPTAEGTTTQWAPLSGTDNALMVDDPTTIDSDTTYNASATVNDYDTYVTSNLETTSGTVYGLQSVLATRKDGPQSVRQVASVVRHSGTDYTASSLPAITAGYICQETIYNQDPTSTNWTIASVNAAEFGVKLVT